MSVEDWSELFGE